MSKIEEEIEETRRDKIKALISKIKAPLSKRKERKKSSEVKERIILTPEEREEVEIAAYALSKRYGYHKLMKAADTRGAAIKEGREVHGYMQRMYSIEKYEWLVVNDVFDIACDFAWKKNQQEIFNVVKNYNFDDAIINIVSLPKKVCFDKYRESEFDKIIILTQKEPFETAVTWIDNQPWIDDDNYKTTVTLAPCNFLNTGFTLWDLPVIILKDAVGMDKLFFEAIADANEITRMRDQLLKKHIYTKRQEEDTTKEQLLEKDIKYEQLEERHQLMVDDIKFHDSRSPIEKFEEFNKRYNKQTKHYFARANIKKIIILFVIIALAIIIIAGLSFIFAPRPELTEVPEEVGLMISSIFKGGT